jgi:hypothetical protein
MKNELNEQLQLKPKKNKKEKYDWVWYICLVFILGLIFYGTFIYVPTRDREIDTFCNQFNMTRGSCNKLCCEVKINENLIQQVTIKKIDGRWIFVQEGLR